VLYDLEEAEKESKDERENKAISICTCQSLVLDLEPGKKTARLF